jgi:hypothetical protein
MTRGAPLEERLGSERLRERAVTERITYLATRSTFL